MPYPVPPHPGFADPVALKIWEIRHQLAINVEMIERGHPDAEPRILPHIAETLTGHVFDRLAELEAMLKPRDDLKEIADRLEIGMTADIWFDADGPDDEGAAATIETTQEAMAEAASILRKLLV